MTKKQIIIIAGPTASGKSELALKIAEKFGNKSGIVNADSVQTYKALQILSARPSPKDTALVPHYLYGYLEANETQSVYDWLKQASACVEHIERPIVVGGTGFYIDALINGVCEIPEIDPEVRSFVRSLPLEDVRNRLPDFPYRDSQRIRRALEVLLSTGKPISYFYSQPKRKFIQGDFLKVLILPPRDVLYHRCNSRFKKMLEIGAIEEVKCLLKQTLDTSFLKAIGITEITSYLKSEITFSEMVEQAQAATRHYAKRQITWFRNKFCADVVLSDSQDNIITL